MQVFSVILVNQTSAEVVVWWSCGDGDYVKTLNVSEKVANLHI